MESKYHLNITKLALSDIDSIVHNWERYGLQSRNRLLATIERIKLLLGNMPTVGQIYDERQGIRVRSLPGYPFAFFYRILDDELEVLAFALFSELQDPEKTRRLVVDRSLDLN